LMTRPVMGSYLLCVRRSRHVFSETFSQINLNHEDGLHMFIR
jgi:hypothetical protein